MCVCRGGDISGSLGLLQPWKSLGDFGPVTISQSRFIHSLVVRLQKEKEILIK